MGLGEVSVAVKKTIILREPAGDNNGWHELSADRLGVTPLYLAVRLITDDFVLFVRPPNINSGPSNR